MKDLINKIIYKLFDGRFLSNKEITKIIVEKIRSGGGSVGEHLDLYRRTNIDLSYPYMLHIGNHVTITGATVLTHDACLRKDLGYTKVAKVSIGDYVFIGTGSIVLPGVTIGDHVVIGAGTVVTHDIPSNSVVVGNPGKVIKKYDELMEKEKLNKDANVTFECFPKDVLKDPEKVKKIVNSGIGYVK